MNDLQKSTYASVHVDVHFGMWLDWILFHWLETQVLPRMLPLPPACLPLPRHPARLPMPHLPWPRLAQVSPFVFCLSVVDSFQFVDGCLLLSKVSWIFVGCWLLSLCVFMCRLYKPSCCGLKLGRMVDQSEDNISHTLWSVFVRDGASHVISANRKRL